MKLNYLAMPLLLIPLVASAENKWYGVISLVGTTNTPNLFEVNAQGKRWDHEFYQGSDSNHSSGFAFINLAAGYQFNPQLAVELELQHRPWSSSYYAEADLDNPSEFDSRNNAFLLNAVYQIPIRARTNVYVKTSLGSAKHSIQTTSENAPAEQIYPKNSSTTSAFGLGVGIKQDFSKNVSMGVEYRRMDLGEISSINSQKSTLTFDMKASELTGNIYVRF